MNPSGMRKTVGGVALSFVLAVVLGISGAIAPGGGAALGASTTLTILGGEVQVSRNGGAFEPAADGAIIGPGDVIRTGADSRAVLTYFEGSTVSVEPSSELAIDEASSNPDGSTVVVMSQNLGRTWHVVTKLITGGSKYEVRTPAATASVRGTEFAVGVARDASGNSVTDVATTGGAVAVAAPATAADPQPEPVVVPAGFRTSATAGERKAQAPTIVPEPERKVTVTIGSANALVVDPLGRSNGYKDGKLVLQTPGAQVVRTAGTLLITLPDLPDGKISTVVARATDAGASSGDVPVITSVQERGKSSTLIEDAVKQTETVSGLEMKKSGAGPEATPEVRRVTEDEKKNLNTGKVVEAPKVETRSAVARPGLGGDPAVLAKLADERRGEPAGGSASRSAQAPAVAPAPVNEEPRFVQPLPFQGAPSAANQQREETKRQDASNKIEAEIKGSEQLQKAAETATKVAESAKIVAESGQQRATDDKTRHEQQLKAAEEAAREAQRKLLEATDAAKKKEAEEAARQADAQKQASEAARRRSENEAKQKADEATRAAAAMKAAAEVAERARLDGERLRQVQKEQQDKQQQGGGSSGGGSSGGGSSGGGSSGGGSGNDGKKGSGKSEEINPGGGGVKLPEPPRSGKP